MRAGPITMAGEVATKAQLCAGSPFASKETIVDPPPGTFDREVDSNPGTTAHVQLKSLGKHQRIVVNPFLAVLAWVAVLGMMRKSLEIRSMPLLMAAFGLMLFACLLLQFHCLDCGATGWLARWRNHACPAVVMRVLSGETPRFPGLSVMAQLIAWFVLVGAVLVLSMVVVIS
jgi:hypothetical protein